MLHDSSERARRHVHGHGRRRQALVYLRIHVYHYAPRRVPAYGFEVLPDRYARNTLPGVLTDAQLPSLRQHLLGDGGSVAGPGRYRKRRGARIRGETQLHAPIVSEWDRVGIEKAATPDKQIYNVRSPSTEHAAATVLRVIVTGCSNNGRPRRGRDARFRPTARSNN